MARKAKPKKFTVCDGELVLEMIPAGKGWYAVTSPMEPSLHTQAKSIEQAFDMARDALAGLHEARKLLAERRTRSSTTAA